MLYHIRYIIAIIVMLLCSFLASAQMNPKYKFEEALKLIQDNYVDEVNDERLVDSSIKAMLSDLDPHSQYVGREEAEERRQMMSGSFAGIGVQFLKSKDSTYVVDVNPDGPAVRAGLKVGDLILAIDGASTSRKEIKNQDIMRMIRGEKGVPVVLTVKHPGMDAQREITIVRENILNKSVLASYMVDKEIGYISLSIFTESTRTEVDEALKKLIGKGMKKLIFDLQSNGGGNVQSAIGVADEFLPKEKLVFYSVTNTGVKDHYFTGGYGRFYDGPMVVLIDESTASSSEIVTGALQDWDRAVIVGRRSFGKGLMQKSFEMTDGSILMLTGARYYTPTGRSIQKPYNKGKQDYFKDFERRMASKELMDESVISVADSLKYKTLTNGRIVYGGGGIIPDKFVPIDTVYYSGWMTKLMNSGLINDLCFGYLKTRRVSILKDYPDFNKFKNEYVISDEWINVLTQSAARNKIQMPATISENTARDLKIEIKAQMAALLYTGDNYMIPIRNESNQSYLEAIKILKDKKEYTRLLKIGNNHNK